MSLEGCDFHPAECRGADLAQSGAVNELMIQLERETWAPGENVKGWARVLAPFDCRALEVALEYCDWSDDYFEVSWRHAVPLHAGAAQPGQWWYYELPLPPDAPAGFRSVNGGVGWQVHVIGDRPGWDTHASAAIDVAGERTYAPEALATAPAPAPASVGKVSRRLRRAEDFSVEAEPVTSRRGGTVHVRVSVPDPSQVEGELRLGVVCREYWAQRVRASWKSVGRLVTKRVTREAQLHQQWQPVAPNAGASFTLPPEGPCSHDGQAMRYHWVVIAQDARENRADRVAERPIRVLA
jgi:hypothetical protein